MKNTFRALFGVSALALLLVAMPVMAAEVDVKAENSTTGADSDNENEYDVESDLDVDVENDAEVDNEADADVDTGDNEQNRNTSGGDLETGTVEASTEWENVVNAGAALMDDGDGLEVSGDFTNDTTGADSDNSNELDVENDVELDLENTADLFNQLDLDADTGDNEQNRNTEAGDLETGDVTVDSMIANWVNNDSGFASAAAGSTSVDVSAENHKTGADSDNDNEFDIENDLEIDVENDAEIDNQFDIDADTGGNEQNRNTKGGSMKTGSVDVTTEVVNHANNGSNAAGAAAGHGLDVSGDFTNDTTGADSDNSNELDVDNDVEIDVENDAEVNNELDVDADTGNNEQNRNTEGGDMETGSVSINFSAHNEVNSN